MNRVGQTLRDGFEFRLQGRGQDAARLRLFRRHRRLGRFCGDGRLRVLGRGASGLAEEIELLFRLARFEVREIAAQSAFS